MAIDVSNGSSESNSWSSNVEVGIESLNETVADDESLTQGCWQVETHDTDDADCLGTFLDLKNVIFGLEDVAVWAEFELQSGELGEGAAVNLFLLSWTKACSHFFNDLSRANNDWCSSIDDTNQIWADFVAGSVKDDITHFKHPIVVHFQWVILEAAWCILLIDSTQDQSWSFLSCLPGQVEGETVAFNSALFVEQIENKWHVVHADGWPGHTQNTIEFGSKEWNT